MFETQKPALDHQRNPMTKESKNNAWLSGLRKKKKVKKGMGWGMHVPRNRAHMTAKMHAYPLQSESFYESMYRMWQVPSHMLLPW